MDLSDLKKRLAESKIFHAYIVTGGNAAGRLETAKLIARAAVCSGETGAPCGVCRDCKKALRGIHPDIETVEKTGREHSVDSMRALRARAFVVPNEAKRGVYIIADADDMNPQAQNAMLKVFEEPPSHAVFVLLADNPMRLLETVRSRCETVRLTPESEPDEGGGGGLAAAVAEAFERGDNLALVRALSPVEKLGRNDLPDFIDGLRRHGAGLDGKISPGDMENLIKTLDEADRMAAVNVSAGHISALLLAKLIKIDKQL